MCILPVIFIYTPFFLFLLLFSPQNLSNLETLSICKCELTATGAYVLARYLQWHHLSLNEKYFCSLQVLVLCTPFSFTSFYVIIFISSHFYFYSYLYSDIICFVINFTIIFLLLYFYNFHHLFCFRYLYLFYFYFSDH